MAVKSKEEVQKTCCGDVYTLEEFCEICESGGINRHDGHGYFHDGEKETDVSAFSDKVDPDYVWKNYYYVCWYNK